MKAPLTSASWIWVAVASLYPAALASADESPHLTPEQFRQCVVTSLAKIQAWHVEYESDPGKDSQGPFLHRVVAARQPDKFYHWSSHGTRTSDWREDPLQQRLVLSGTQVVIERPFHRQFRTFPLQDQAPLPGTMPQEFLFLALGWWPFPKRPCPSNSEGIVAGLQSIATSEKYRLSATPEEIEGRWCQILESPGRERLWIDCNHGCAVLRRELYDPKTGSLMQRVESTGHREIQPGIWVPSAFRNRICKAKAEPAESTLKVLSFSINEQVRDDLFVFQASPGSIQSSGKEMAKQVVPGGTDYLDGLVDWIDRRFRFRQIPSQSADSRTEAWIEYCIIVIGGLFLITRLLRRSRSQQTPQDDVRDQSRSDTPEALNS